MNIEVDSLLQNSEFEIRYSIFLLMILFLPGHGHVLPLTSPIVTFRTLSVEGVTLNLSSIL